LAAGAALALLFATATCPGAGADPAILQRASSTIQAAQILDHIRTLASDEFEGRLPASKGEELTVAYLIGAFERSGLEPAGPNGAWTQAVPMVGVTATSRAALHHQGRTTTLEFPQDYVGWSPQLREQITVQDSELVFVGYGIEAPEYGWDDFKGADVQGKTLLMLVGDPPLADPADPARLDPSLFKGRAMTYYGRWTYKYEIAAAKGAAAAIVIHETGPAGYPYFVVINSWGRENFMLKNSVGRKVLFESWMSLERTRQTVAAGGSDFDDLKRRALRKDFRPVPLGVTWDVAVTNRLREVTSRNVLAKLPGRHPTRKHEWLVYSSHWDHLGRNAQLEGDQIFNGAADNASGVACMLAIAQGFRAIESGLDRTILFLATTAEEQGLLGAKYYAENPVHPLRQTVANINIDVASLRGRRSDVGVIGLGNSTLDDLAAAFARGQGRSVRSELSPEKGYFYRSDHFELAKVGIPALYLDHTEGAYPGKPADYGKQRLEEYYDRDYHKVSDDVKADWDLSGAEDDAKVLFLVGAEVAMAPAWPEWKPGTEFKAIRDASLRGAAPERR
jgi:Zn-dependent M28 family amino/carboxypeptidase